MSQIFREIRVGPLLAKGEGMSSSPALSLAPNASLISSSRRPSLAALLACALLCAACGGAVAEDPGGVGEVPPPRNLRFAMSVDGKPVGLGPPVGSRFEVTRDGATTSFISISADESPRMGDSIRSAGVTLMEPFVRGTFDCTPTAAGDTPASAGAVLSPGAFFGFTPTLRDCVVVVEYAATDRVVGRFSVRAHAPVNSSLSGKVSAVEGEFDVEVKPVRLQ